MCKDHVRIIAPTLTAFIVSLALHCPALAMTQTCPSNVKLYFADSTVLPAKGFADPILGQTRRATACAVFDYLAADVFALSGNPPYPEIKFAVSEFDGTGPLATATIEFPAGATTGFVGGALRDLLVTGVDTTPGPNGYESIVTVDFGTRGVGAATVPVHSGYPASVAGTFDLFSILLHEITHSLGVASAIRANGTSSFGGGYSYWDKSLTDGLNAPLLSPSAAPTSAMTPLALKSGALRYAGPGNSDIQSVYSPPTFEQGSSLSHFDADRDGFPYVMRPASSGGENRKLTMAEIEALCDIGYTLKGTQCANHYPIAVDDADPVKNATKPGVKICIDVLANDSDKDGDAVSIDPASVTVLSGGGTAAIDPVTKKLCYTPSLYFAGTANLIYRPTDGSKLGGAASIQVPVISTYCPDDPTNRLCNGGFERGTSALLPLAISGLTCGVSLADNWCSAGAGTADLLIRGAKSAGISLGIPVNYHSVNAPGGKVETWSGPGGANDRYAGGFDCSAGCGAEGVQNKLIAPLTPGKKYRLEFYAFSARAKGITINHDPEIRAFLDDSPGTTGSAIRKPSPNAQALVLQTIPTAGSGSQNNGWTKVQTTFIAAPNANTLTHFFLQPAESAPAGALNYVYYDNVSIRPVNAVASTLTLTKYASVLNPKLGQALTFHVKVCNTGTATQTNIKVQDKLPPGLKYTGGMSAYPVHTIASLAAGACTTIDIGAQVRLSAPVNTPIVNCAGIVGPKNPIFSCATITVPATDLAILKTVDNPSPSMGGPLNFTITIANQGPGPAAKILASDILPPWLDYVGNTAQPPVSYAPATGAITIPNLAKGESVTFTIQAKLKAGLCAASESRSNVATITALDVTDQNTANDVATAVIQLPRCPTP